MSETVIVEDEVVTIITVGEQGPPGPGLDSTDALPEGTTHRYDRYFEQAFTNKSSVTVNHNLGKKPAVTVIDSAGDQVVGDVEYNGLNQVILSFSSSFSGIIVLN